MKYIQTFGKKMKTDYEKVVIKLLMWEGHFIIIWETSKQETQSGSSLPEKLKMKFPNKFMAHLMDSAHTFHKTLPLDSSV